MARVTKKTGTRKKSIPDKEPVSNDAQFHIDSEAPYIAQVRIRGSADYLFHRYSIEDVEAKQSSKKGSEARKTDNLEAYVWRHPETNNLCIPGNHLYGAMHYAAKRHKDPVSTRKSAQDLFKASVIVDPDMYDMGYAEWEYVHQCRAVVQRNAVPRSRPAARKGWEAEFNITCLQAELITPDFLYKVLRDAGMFQGMGDYRPTYGRFNVVGFNIKTYEEEAA